MINYSIKYLDSITGIKAHTIRIWEKRYNLLVPKRTKTNIRYYDNEDLKKILNIRTLLNVGYKISKIANFEPKELLIEIKKITNQPKQETVLYNHFTNEMLLSTFEFNKLNFDKIFNSCVLKFGFSVTIEKIIYAVMSRIGALWLIGEVNPAQEHFLSNLTRQKIFSATDGLLENQNSKKKCILFLPENEEHDITLLYTNYLLLGAGIKTVYLGVRTPIESIEKADRVIKATHLVFFVVRQISTKSLNTYILDLSKKFSKHQIVVCGSKNYGIGLKLPANVTFHDSPTSSKRYFKIS